MCTGGMSPQDMQNALALRMTGNGTAPQQPGAPAPSMRPQPQPVSPGFTQGTPPGAMNPGFMQWGQPNMQLPYQPLAQPNMQLPAANPIGLPGGIGGLLGRNFAGRGQPLK